MDSSCRHLSGCGTHSTTPATSRVGNRQPHLPNVERNRPRICRPEQPGSRIPRPPPTPSPRHQIYTLPCLNKFQSSCHSNRSHKFRRVLQNDRRCCNNANKTQTTANNHASNTRNSPGAHGSKGSYKAKSEKKSAPFKQRRMHTYAAVRGLCGCSGGLCVVLPACHPVHFCLPSRPL